MSDITTSIRTRVYTGIEVEGPNPGQRVLFVPARYYGPGELTETITKAFEKFTDLKRVYFGAGNVPCRDLTVTSTLLQLLHLARVRQLKVDVETNLAVVAYQLHQRITSFDTLQNTHVRGWVIHTGAYVELAAVFALPAYIEGLVHKIVTTQDIDWQTVHDGKHYHTSMQDPEFLRDEYV